MKSPPGGGGGLRALVAFSNTGNTHLTVCRLLWFFSFFSSRVVRFLIGLCRLWQNVLIT